MTDTAVTPRPPTATEAAEVDDFRARRRCEQSVIAFRAALKARGATDQTLSNILVEHFAALKSEAMQGI